MRKWLVSGCAAADKKKSGKRNGNNLRSFIRMNLNVSYLSFPANPGPITSTGFRIAGCE
jgi:hypothetical protein